MKTKVRLASLLVSRGLVETASQAQRLVMAGQVRVDGQVVLQPGMPVAAEAEITLESVPRFVSRGGEKLEGALQAFPVQVEGRICADIGASTGGFTDCLLQHGAAKVYAIDVGKGILDWRLRQDTRVVVMEGTNARHVERLPEPVTLVTMDVSFISIKVLLPEVRDWLVSKAENDLIVLIKPQFEASKEQAGQGKGVIRDPAVHRQVLQDILNFAQTEGFCVLGLIRSPLLGPKGNTEFLAWLGFPDKGKTKRKSSKSTEELLLSAFPA